MESYESGVYEIAGPTLTEFIREIISVENPAEVVAAAVNRCRALARADGALVLVWNPGANLRGVGGPGQEHAEVSVSSRAYDAGVAGFVAGAVVVAGRAAAVAPGAAAEREAAAVIAEQARQGLPQAIQSRAEELLTPQARADAASFLKAYAEPAVWALGAQQAASALGMDPGTQAILAGAAGMIGGRTRAGKALANRLTRPAHQVAVGNALRRIGAPPAVPPSATQTAAIGLDPELTALINAWRGRPGFAPAAASEEDQ